MTGRVPSSATPAMWRGMAVYVGLTLSLAWVPAVLLYEVWDGVRGLFPTRLLAASAYYTLTMGWQPFLAVWVVRHWIDPPGHLDHGLRSVPGPLLAVGAAASLAFTLASYLVSWSAGSLDLVTAPNTSPTAEPEVSLWGPSLGAAVLLTVAFLCTLALISVQAFSEELGWRGYFLTRLMQWLGPWPGLLLHGFVWGMWYAPVVLLAAGDSASAPSRAASFVVTCTLLGALLGWLRLAAQSVVLAVIVNAVLTVAAGLPFILRGVDVGPRGSAYGPAGWIPLLLAVGILFTGPARRVVVTPQERDSPLRKGSGLWLLVEHMFSGNGTGTRRMPDDSKD